jgi:hypothetical protein
MAAQPSLRPEQASDFFPDGQTTRPQVPGTVARGHLHWGQPVFTGAAPGLPSVREQLLAEGAARLEQGKQKGEDKSPELDAFPFPIDREALLLGQNRYMIFCVVCHDTLGEGHGPPPVIFSR